MDNFLVKALNPDDDSETMALVRLFERCHGTSFPLPSVYHPRFWKTHSGLRFTSLIALDGRRVVAHLALRPDLDNRTNVQLYLPACDPEYASSQPEIEGRFLRMIDRQSQRQSWRLLYGYVLGNLGGMSLLSERSLGLHEVAIWPNALPLECSDLSRRGHVILTQRPLSIEGRGELLFAPENHREIVSSIYDGLGLRNTFHFDSPIKRKTAAARPEEPSVSADRRAIEARSYRRSGISLSLVEPGLISDTTSALTRLKSQGRKFPFHYIGCNMRDPKTPAFCNLVEDHGYRFCGVLPLHSGRQNILYYNADAAAIDLATLHRPQSVLARYLQTYSFSRPGAHIAAALAPEQDSSPG